MRTTQGEGITLPCPEVAARWKIRERPSEQRDGHFLDRITHFCDCSHRSAAAKQMALFYFAIPIVTVVVTLFGFGFFCSVHDAVDEAALAQLWVLARV